MLSLFRSHSLSSAHPLSDFWYSAVGMRTAAGIDVTDSVAMTYSAVWACTRVLSASGSCLPLNLHRRRGKMTAIASDNPVQRLLHDEPNAEMGSMGLRSLGIMRQVNQGNFFCEIQRDQLRRPMALWPIDKSRMAPLRPDQSFARQYNLEAGRLAWRIKRDDGAYDYLSDRDVFNVPSIVSDDGIIGKGVIENARETIAHGIATVRQGAAYMKNSSRPSVVISGGKFKTAEDRQEYRRMWMDVHGGPENNAKPAMLPEGSEVKVLSFSPEDSQFIQTLQHSIEDIARWYGVPPHMIQHLLRATYSNIEHQGIDFVVYSLIPWLKLWEEEIWRKLLSPIEQGNHYAKHNVTGLLRGDSAARAAYYQSLWQLGAYSINEIRELEDMNPIEGGDEHFVQTSYATLDRVVNPPEPPASTTIIEPDDENDEDELSIVTTTINGFLDLLKQERQPAPIVNVPDVTIPDELAKQIASLVEYTRAPKEIDATLVADVQEAAKLMVSSVVARSLELEISKVSKLCAKDAKAFFTELDEYYTTVIPDKLTAELSRPVFAYARSNGVTVDSGTLTRSVVDIQLAAAREEVLGLTECSAEEWPQLGERFAKLATTWRETRNEQVIQLIEDFTQSEIE